MKTMETCFVKGCNRTGKYFMGIEEGEIYSKKKWGLLCGWHDNYFGIRNLMACGMNEDEAKNVNKELKNTA